MPFVCKNARRTSRFDEYDDPVAKNPNKLEPANRAPCGADSRPIWLVGLSFDSATRQLADTAVMLQAVEMNPLIP